ncbi:MAG: glycosyltransferase family 1 protein [Planctomycetes bacterium]|nr:glycosyltransferase family 1 protein [Planctomycetota bacterium]
MVRILCNLPLECFDEREALEGVELVTYGPADRMNVDGVQFPFDLVFDPSNGSWDELVDLLPDGFRPDLLLIYWPDQEPLPAGLEHCPIPIVGVFSDYNLALPYLAGLWPFFDVVLCDRAGQDLFRRLSFADVRYWCQYAHKRPFHHLMPEVGARDIDIGFAGNLNPAVQRERTSWIERLQAMRRDLVEVETVSGRHGLDYGRFLNRCKIGFNRSIRGEMNLRGFEVPACGAVLMMERDNLEVREFFEPDEECVLYGDDDFEPLVLELLVDDARRERIARAGHRRVQEHRLGKRIGQLANLARNPGPGRPRSSEADRVLGRAVAMILTWAPGEAVAAAALAANHLAPDDPRTLNLLALATLRWRGADGGEAAWKLFCRALQVSPSYVPAATNLCALAHATNDPGLATSVQCEVDRRIASPSWFDLDGPTLPFGYAARAIDRSLALQSAVRDGDPQLFAATLVD